MSDIVARIEAALLAYHRDQWAREYAPELVAELKAARAEAERLRALERAVQDELTNISDDFVYDRLAKAVGLANGVADE